MKVLITGANGQLGQSFRSRTNLATSLGIELTFADRLQLDITSPESIEHYLKDNPVDYIVNTAAYTAVDKAEEESVLANLINCDGPANLAHYCSQYNCGLLHVSTDYVFDGNQEDPYSEEDHVSPLGVYGTSKRHGEIAVLDQFSNAIILRTSWVFSEYGNNFLKTMLRLAEDRDQISVVCDQWGAPTYAPHIAEAILNLIQSKSNPGIYHFSGSEKTHWQAFALEIFNFAKQLNTDFNAPTVLPISSDQYPTTVTRPLNSHLNIQKILQLIPQTSCDWRQGIREALTSLEKNS